ncbi:hypothetical protein J6590_053373 [Homalodisca vitripennis]|nr:hypothetical protein J6590_053373 [Homalodisca vitripennis]
MVKGNKLSRTWVSAKNVGMNNSILDEAIKVSSRSAAESGGQQRGVGPVNTLSRPEHADLTSEIYGSL